jgi:crotonobetaine/carnitine-CoA ligase
MMEQTITSRLAAQAHEHADDLALISDDLELTWAQLNDRVLSMSALLRQMGIKKADRVALMYGNQPAFIVSWFAIANIGAITVCVNTALMGEGLRYVLTNSESKLLIIQASLLQQKQAYLDDLPEPLDVLAIENEHELFTKTDCFVPDSLYDGIGSDPVSIMYTSGTTGRPKGVLNCHEAFLASGRQLVDMLSITSTDRIMVFLPLFHANPQMYAVMSALDTGCSIVLRPKFSVTRFFEDARQFHCTMFTYVGTVLSMLTNRLPDGDRNHSITRCVGGGCPPSAWQALQERFAIKPYELYGMTEIGGWVTSNSVSAYRFGSCGKARADVLVSVVDVHDNPLAPGMSGEIVVRPIAPNIFLLGYWNDPETMWASSRNFWFHTGDIGSLDEDGYLYFQGRIKEIIRRAGENISPFEIEAALLKFPGIHDAAVVAVPDPIYGEEIKAYVVATQDIRLIGMPQFLANHIPAHMIPRYVQLVAQIPRTETEKIQRHLLVADATKTVDLKDSPQHASH